MTERSHNRLNLENGLALTTLVFAFATIFMGGTVNPNGASLACPEALFVCHGQWFPELKGGVLFEHGHRLVAMSLGILQIALTVILWRRRRELRGLAVISLIWVIAQGMLGAATVAARLSWVASTIHLVSAMGYIGLLVYLAFRTRAQRSAGAMSDRRFARLTPWVAAAAVLILLQILLGGLMRHNGGALASIQFPLHDGSLWPEGPLALKLHMAHRGFGVLVGLFAAAVGGAVFWVTRGAPRIRLMAISLPVLVALQVLLGSLVILYFRPIWVVVFHFTVGGALWVVSLTLWLHLKRRTGDAS